MLLKHISYLGMIFLFATKLHHSVRITWDHKSCKAFVPISVSPDSLARKQQLIILAIIVVMLQGVFQLHQGKVVFLQKFIWGMAIIIWTSSWAHSQALNTKATTLCAYINGLLDFERKHTQVSKTQQVSLIEFANMMIAYGFSLTVLGFPLMFVYAIHNSNPCQASLIGYWIIPGCNQIIPEINYWTDTTLKLVVFVCNHWVWSFGLSAVLVAFSGVQIMCTMAMHSALKIFAANYTQDRSDVFNSTMKYRTLQLLARMMNGLIQNELNGTIACSATFLLALCEATLVKLPLARKHLAVWLLFGFLLLNCLFAVVVVLGGYAQVHETSKDVLRKLTKHLLVVSVKKERSQRRRFRNSCSVIKVRLGSINFVEALTPLNFVDFANGLAVQILLVGSL